MKVARVFKTMFTGVFIFSVSTLSAQSFIPPVTGSTMGEEVVILLLAASAYGYCRKNKDTSKMNNIEG